MTSAPLQHQVCPPHELASRLLAGEAGLMPTDTLPALAALPRHAAQIWELKRRPQEKPLILMGAGIAQLQPLLGLPWKSEWLALAGRGWPGALTLVLPAQGPLAEALNPGRGSLGLRIPACAAALELLELTGPLATTSANPSGEPAATTAAEAAAFFPKLPLLGPLPWVPASGQASTVLAWACAGAGAGAWQLLRSGAVPFPLPSPCPPLCPLPDPLTMAALLVLVAITMGLYHWLGNPLNGLLNGVFQAGWLPLLPALVLIWLLAGKR